MCLNDTFSVPMTFSRLCHEDSFPEYALIASLNAITFNMTADTYDKIAMVHNEFIGHHGVERTIAKLNVKDQHWKGRRRDVIEFINHCPFCMKTKQDRVKINTQPFVTATLEPMQMINIDAIGPLDGEKYILVFIDCFSRFVELYVVLDTTAKAAAKCLMNFMGRYGAPAYIKSDRGTQFVNDVIEELLTLVGTHHLLTLSYSKKENSIVERANKEVMRHLRAIIFDKDNITALNDWEDCLPLVQRIMNASVHSAIGVSPAQLIFGESLQLDRDILIPHNRRDRSELESLSDWASRMYERQAEIMNRARTAQTQHDEFNLHIRETTVNDNGGLSDFMINSYVLVEYHNKPPKLNTQLKGLY